MKNGTYIVRKEIYISRMATSLWTQGEYFYTQLAILLELFLCNIKGQVQSPVKVCEVATNAKLYET